MTNPHSMTTPRPANPWRIAGWGLAAMLLVLPFVAMQLTSEVNWTASDFLFAALLLGGTGLALEFMLRRSGNRAYRWGAALAVLTALATIWVNAAVGMIGDDNDYNWLFVGVVLLAILGSALVRFRPHALVRVMAATAAAQLAVAAGGTSADPRGALLSMAFALPWLLAAALFHAADRSARQR